MIFKEYSDNDENDILTMQRFLHFSRFLYSGGWQVHVCNVIVIVYLGLRPVMMRL